MKDIRKHISLNRELFDDQEPASGHIERFEALLDQQSEQKKKPARRINLKLLLSVAASILLICMVSIKFYNLERIPETTPPNEPNLVDEFYTTNEFYNSRMQEQIAEIMCKLAYADSKSQAQLTKDIEDLLKTNNYFIEEMAQNNNKEVALFYLVNHYKKNIQVLESINEKLGRYTAC